MEKIKSAGFCPTAPISCHHVLHHLSPTDRLTEVAEILAAGILRLRRRTLEGSRREPVCLDFSPDRSGHGTPSERRRKRHGRT